jgi:LysM repeat protein
MRLYAKITAVVAVATIVGASSATAFADTTSNTGTVPAQNTITVQAGDYLAKLAAQNNTTYVRIFDANSQIQDPNLIYPGEVLSIPSATEQLPNRQLPQATTSDETETPAPVVAPQPTVQPEAATVTPATTPTLTSSDQAASPAATPPVASGSIWDDLAQCESGGNWSIDTGNGFYGGLQFTLSSWQAVGGSGYPNQASRSEQIMRAEMLQTQQGWGAWPVCSAKLGL